MKLFYRKYGQGRPLVILHGLFGQSDNWNTLGRRFSEHNLEVFLVDQRNHGLSPHSDEWNYPALSGDILELIRENRLENVILLGHSMGGKLAMHFAIHHCPMISKLIVVDIAPKKYPEPDDGVMEALLAVDFDKVKSRKEAGEILSKHIPDFGTKQFLLKNLYWKEEQKFAWRFNLEVLSKRRNVVGDTFDSENKSCGKPALFLRGERSNYILDADLGEIKRLFPDSELKTVSGAGHWIHADKPNEFFEEAMKFIA